jgi:hypothetical protein
MMNFEESVAMNAAMRKAFSKAMGVEIAPYPKGHMEKMFEAYDKLSGSPGDGWSKKDGRHAQKIMDAIRDDFMNWKPSKEMLADFKPIFAYEMHRYDEMKDDSKLKK